MDNDKIKGAIDDAAGRAKRQVGEWTGDTKAEVEGAAQQVKGKAEKAVGNVKDAVRGVTKDADRNRNTVDNDRDRESVTKVNRE
jgi:uncharacterized protein YjbJ (UPF0337 family)